MKLSPWASLRFFSTSSPNCIQKLRRAPLALPKAQAGCSCPGCGALFQTATPMKPGYVDVDRLGDRLFTVERPNGFFPVLTTPPTLSTTRNRSFVERPPTRLELERLERRFGYTLPANPSQIGPHPELVSHPEKNENEQDYENYINIEDGVRAEDHVHSEGATEGMKNLICKRCHELCNKGFYSAEPAPQPISKPLLQLSQTDRELLSTLWSKNTLIVKVVDLLDFPYSLLAPQLITALPGIEKLPWLLVGNKIDLLPGHGIRTVNQITESLGKSLQGCNLIDTVLTSAKTNFNVQQLHERIISYAMLHKANVLLVGRTNVGKSLLFNSFASTAADNIPKATVSALHGTTVGILRKRLLNIAKASRHIKSKLDLPGRIPKDVWLCDLPGLQTPIPDLVTTYFTREEASGLVVKTKIKPVDHKLRSGESGLIGGFCRIDLMSSDPNFEINLQFYVNSSIPYFRKPTKGVEKLLDESRGKGLSAPPYLQPPVFAYNDLRISEFPMKIAFDANLESVSDGKISADLVFAGGIGWISIGSHPSQLIKIKIWTPGGIGVQLRNPLRANFL